MITVDFREASASKNILDGLIKLGVKVEIGRLDAGDYAISSNETPALVERKEIFNFAGDVASGRLWQQLEKLSSVQDFRKAVLIEGSPALLQKLGRKWSMGSIYGALNSIWLEWNIPLLFTPSKNHTIILLANLDRKLSGERKVEARISKPKTEDYSEVALSMLAQIPYVNTVKAKRILEKFGTVKDVVENLDRIEEVEGIGEKISEAIKKTFTTKFQQ
jgi:ERCC4-type nuclease